MRILSFEDMEKEYGSLSLDPDDLNERQRNFSKLKYSVIVEGNFLEYDNAEKWIKNNLKIETIDFVFYGKTGYDYGFIEYFFEKENDSIRLKNEIPNIYTKYPNGSHSKSDGYDKHILFNL